MHRKTGIHYSLKLGELYSGFSYTFLYPLILS